MSRRIMFLRSSNGHPVGCIAISISKRKNLNSIQYQLSVLNPQDKFNRALARQIAIGRLMENPLHIVIDKNANMHDISLAVMNHITSIGKGKFPTRAVKAAKLWLSKIVPGVPIE